MGSQFHRSWSHPSLHLCNHPLLLSDYMLFEPSRNAHAEPRPEFSFRRTQLRHWSSPDMADSLGRPLSPRCRAPADKGGQGAICQQMSHVVVPSLAGVPFTFLRRVTFATAACDVHSYPPLLLVSLLMMPLFLLIGHVGSMYDVRLG